MYMFIDKYFVLTKIKRKVVHLLKLSHCLRLKLVSVYLKCLLSHPFLVVYFRLTILNFSAL